MGEGYDPPLPTLYHRRATVLQLWMKYTSFPNCWIRSRTVLYLRQLDYPVLSKYQLFTKKNYHLTNVSNFSWSQLWKYPFDAPQVLECRNCIDRQNSLLYSCCIDCWGAWRASLARSLQHGIEFTLPSFMLSRTCMAQCLYN